MVNRIVISESKIKAMLNITNSQSTPTQPGLQVMWQVPVNTLYTHTIGCNSKLSNLRFAYNGQLVPAWLESINNDTATIWIKMPVSIPANSSIALNLYSNSTLNFDGVYWGEAPQLSSTYGQYDNGASVFNNYWNFAGTAVPSGWTLPTGWSVNNGLTTASDTGTIYYVYYSTNSTPPIIEDFYSNLPKNTGSSWNQFFGFVTTPGNRLGWNSYSASGGSSNGQWGMLTSNYGSGGSSTTNFTNTYSGSGIYSVYYTSTSSASLSFNYGSLVDTVTTYIPSSIPPGGYQLSGASFTIQWLRTRAYPPNGVMPTVELM